MATMYGDPDVIGGSVLHLDRWETAALAGSLEYLLTFYALGTGVDVEVLRDVLGALAQEQEVEA
jgi:hypothetical protein